MAGLRLLLIDGNTQRRAALAMRLATAGFDVSETGDIMDAAALLDAAPDTATFDATENPPVLTVADTQTHITGDAGDAILAHFGLTSPASAQESDDRHSTYMRRAIDLAEQAMREPGGKPFGAVIVRHGRIVGEGTSRMFADKDPTALAEIVAIRAACADAGHHTVEGANIYCAIEPDPLALAAIYAAKIDRIYFGATVEDAAKAGFDTQFMIDEMRAAPEKRIMPSTMLLRDEAMIVLASFAEG